MTLFAFPCAKCEATSKTYDIEGFITGVAWLCPECVAKATEPMRKMAKERKEAVEKLLDQTKGPEK